QGLVAACEIAVEQARHIRRRDGAEALTSAGAFHFHHRLQPEEAAAARAHDGDGVAALFSLCGDGGGHVVGADRFCCGIPGYENLHRFTHHSAALPLAAMAPSTLSAVIRPIS